MLFHSFFRSVAVGAVLFSTTLFAYEQAREQALLKTADIHSIMDQMLKEHVKDKEVNSQLIQHAIKIYIDQIDPEKIYFLDSEVNPFIAAKDVDLQKYVNHYQKGEYTVFLQINELTAKAIQRSRRWREELEKNPADLMAAAREPNAVAKGLPEGGGQFESYAKTEKELRERLRDELIRFIAIEQVRFGAKAITGKEARVMRLFENRLKQSEKDYLFQNVEGQAFSKEQLENMQTMHILKALANALDAHTSFFNTNEAYDMRVRLEKGFQGIGVILQEGLDGVVIHRLIEGGPAEKTGLIKANDRLIAIDGKQVIDLPYSSILELIRGQVGSTVDLLISRSEMVNGKEVEKEFHVPVNREVIVVNEDRVDVNYVQFEDGIIGKITLYAFYEGENGVSSESDMKAALKKLNSIGKLKGLVFDLRDNGGGYVIQAVKVAGLFISNGIIVTAKYSNGETKVYRDMAGRIYYNGPLVILTSKATASAAEIVAETLQDYGVALVVGDVHTYGKGSIQHQNVTGKGASSYFKVTVGKYYTVSGLSTQIRGVQADIVVPSPYSNIKIGEQYLDFPLTADKIEPGFDDQLKDISPALKTWYERFYLPTVQKPTERWKKHVSLLRTNSSERLKKNTHYSDFLKEDVSEGIHKAKGEDMQMDEAVEVVKDMIRLKEQENRK